MPKYRPPPPPKPKLKVEVDFNDETVEVEIIVPKWAEHKLKGGEPNAQWEEEGGESMWELYVHDQGQKAAQREWEKKVAKEKAAEKVAEDARVAKLKASHPFKPVKPQLTREEAAAKLGLPAEAARVRRKVNDDE